MNVFFLAAGLGTRLRPLTEKFPKPCVPFLNVPLGYYQFRFLQNQNVSGCVANTFHLPEQVSNLYKKQTYLKTEFSISDESGTKILGSAGGLKKAAQYFTPNDPILLMNADEVFFTQNPEFLQTVLKQHHASRNLATLVVMKHPEAGKKFGAIWCDQKDKVKTILAAKSVPQESSGTLTPWHYIGVMVLDPKVLSLIPEAQETNIFYDILIHQLDRNSVEVFKLDCTWYETGNSADYLAATKKLLTGLTPKDLEFVNSYDPSHLIVNEGGVSLISDSVKISAARLKGYNVIAGSTNPELLAKIKVIEDSVLFENEILNAGYFS